jgi:hypothetical protein
VAKAKSETSQDDGLKDQASEKAQEAVSVAQDKASDLREQGVQRFREQFDQRSNEAGGQMRSFAGALRRAGGDMQTEGNGNAAQWSDQAADRVERLGAYLERTSGDDVLRDIEDFARRRPWMLAGVGMLAGLAAARFMKASSERRYDGGRSSLPSSRPALPSRTSASEADTGPVAPARPVAAGSRAG